MTTEESIFFRLADSYARTQHQCFLAEMSFRAQELGYFLCFCPLDESRILIKKLRESSSENLVDRLKAVWTCKYLMISTQDVKTAGSLQQLPSSLVDQLDAELPKLRQVIEDSHSGER